MGFLDKAKKLAEQAQTKLDEVQSQVNQQGSSQAPPQGPITEYDKHGRAIPPQQTASPPHGDPLAPGSVPPPAPGGPTPDPGAPQGWGPPTPPTPPGAGWGAPPHGDPIDPPDRIDPPDPPGAVTPGVPQTAPSAPVEGTSPPPPVPGVPSSPPAEAGTKPPAMPDAEDRNHPSYAPPKLTSGDPLAG
jgi:hypothetical protein